MTAVWGRVRPAKVSTRRAPLRVAAKLWRPINAANRLTDRLVHWRMALREDAPGEWRMSMPLLLEDLAEETSASNRRTADRLDEEMRELERQLERLGQARTPLEGLQERTIVSARQSTDHAIGRLNQAEGIWRSALASLPRMSAEESVPMLRHLLDIFEAGRRLARSPQAMWDLGVSLGISPERLDELVETERRFDELAREARRAIDHRTEGWQPADPERLALGLRVAREGKTVKADEARAWFLARESMTNASPS